MIDTVEKRRMVIDFGKIRGTGMPLPPAGISSPQARAHILNLYYETAVPVIDFFWRNKNRLTGMWRSKTAPSNSWQSKTSPSSAWQGKTTPQDGSTQEI